MGMVTLSYDGLLLFVDCIWSHVRLGNYSAAGWLQKAGSVVTRIGRTCELLCPTKKEKKKKCSNAAERDANLAEGGSNLAEGCRNAGCSTGRAAARPVRCMRREVGGQRR